MAQPSRDEIIAYIQEVSAKYKVDPLIVQRILDGESGLNPQALGDYNKAGHPQSKGIAQYFEDGLGPDLLAATGKRPGEDWKNDIDFMVQHAVSTQGPTGGWNPWHAAANQGIGQFEGLPGGSTTAAGATPASRGRGGQAMPPSRVAIGQPQGQDQGLLAALQKFQKPETQALSSMVLRKMGVGDPNSTKETTLAGLALDSMGFGKSAKEKLAEKSVEKVNPFSPTSDEDQVAQNMAKKKRPTVGSSLVGMFTGQPAPTNPQTTLGAKAFTGLFGPGGLF